MILLPELWYRMGEAQLARGRAAAGIDALNHSIKAKNDYWPAYLLIAASYEKLRLYNDAIAALNSGLEVDAGQKDLMRELERLKSARSRAGSSTEKTDSRTPKK
jgi:tetratricopeptide (TPR) repeat protein